MVVVVTHEFNVASYFSEAGNLNGRNAEMCSDGAGPSSRRSVDLSFQVGHKLRTCTISPTTSWRRQDV